MDDITYYILNAIKERPAIAQDTLITSAMRKPHFYNTREMDIRKEIDNLYVRGHIEIPSQSRNCIITETGGQLLEKIISDNNKLEEQKKMDDDIKRKTLRNFKYPKLAFWLSVCALIFTIGFGIYTTINNSSVSDKIKSLEDKVASIKK